MLGFSLCKSCAMDLEDFARVCGEGIFNLLRGLRLTEARFAYSFCNLDLHRNPA